MTTTMMSFGRQSNFFRSLFPPSPLRWAARVFGVYVIVGATTSVIALGVAIIFVSIKPPKPVEKGDLFKLQHIFFPQPAADKDYPPNPPGLLISRRLSPDDFPDDNKQENYSAPFIAGFSKTPHDLWQRWAWPNKGNLVFGMDGHLIGALLSIEPAGGPTDWNFDRGSDRLSKDPKKSEWWIINIVKPDRSVVRLFNTDLTLYFASTSMEGIKDGESKAYFGGEVLVLDDRNR